MQRLGEEQQQSRVVADASGPSDGSGSFGAAPGEWSHKSQSDHDSATITGKRIANGLKGRVAYVIAVAALAAFPVDKSTVVCAELLLPELAEMPALNDLRKLLEMPPSVRLPVAPSLIRKLSVDEVLADTVAAHLEADTINNAFGLSIYLSACLSFIWTPGNEQHTLLGVEALLIAPLAALDLLAPAKVRLCLSKQRDTADSSSGMTRSSCSGKALRPDLQLRTGDGRLLFKGEDKAYNLTAAVTDLCTKTTVWSPLLYGTLPYLLCYAAAGPSLQLYAIPRIGLQTPIPISCVYDMSSVRDRVSLLCVAVQLHRLLSAVERELPRSVLIMDKDLEHKHLRADDTVAWTRVVRLESATFSAIKRVIGWAAFSKEFGADLSVLIEAYACSAPLRGLVRSKRPPRVEGDEYSVRLAPLGLTGDDAKPRNENELRAAAHGLLHGLAALHAAGIVHRDVRWANVARDESQRYFLIDLETCARAGTVPAPTCRLCCWDSYTLEVPPSLLPTQDAIFSCTSDIYLLGCMLREVPVVHLSPEAECFVASLRHARPSAATALKDPWIACVGSPCQVAGA